MNEEGLEYEEIEDRSDPIGFVFPALLFVGVFASVIAVGLSFGTLLAILFGVIIMVAFFMVALL